VPLRVLLLLLLLPESTVAQGLPPFRPINPVASSRSGVSFEPFRAPHAGRWVADVGVEYASTIEYNVLPQSSFLLDSELLRVRAAVSRDLSPKAFVLAEAELLGAYAGMFDGALEWYHGLLGIEIPERERRPRNDFLYAADLVGSGPLLRDPGDFFLGDLRLGVGLRVHSRVQSIVALTLPTNTGPAGYGRRASSTPLDFRSRGGWSSREASPPATLRPTGRSPAGSARSSSPAAPECVGVSGDPNRSTGTSSSTAPTTTTRPSPPWTGVTSPSISAGSLLEPGGGSFGLA
jgi:hypothetical protein